MKVPACPFLCLFLHLNVLNGNFEMKILLNCYSRHLKPTNSSSPYFPVNVFLLISSSPRLQYTLLLGLPSPNTLLSRQTGLSIFCPSKRKKFPFSLFACPFSSPWHHWSLISSLSPRSQDGLLWFLEVRYLHTGFFLSS